MPFNVSLVSGRYHGRIKLSTCLNQRAVPRNVPRIRAFIGGGGGGIRGNGRGGGNHGSPGGGGNHFHENHSICASLTQNEKKKKQQKILLTVSAFAVTRAAFSRITRRFSRVYQEETGQEVRFRMSYGGSGIQARAVIDGLPADVVALALPLDVIKIEQAGLIDPGWQKRCQNDGIYAESVVSIVVRKGNPFGIDDWSNLTQEGVEIVTANPKTAGVARWNFLALWGHRMAKGEKEAIKYVTEVFDHVPVQPRDAREASDVFYKQEVGDALLTYENEVIMTNKMVGDDFALPYVVPNNNVKVQLPVAIVSRNMREKSDEEREAAEAFLKFLFTAEAQKEFVSCGLRSVNSAVKKETESNGMFPAVKDLWTVEKKQGGWLEAQSKFFDADKILDDIQMDVSRRKMAEARQRQ